MPYETKKYQDSLLFFNDIINNGYLKELDLDNEDEEIKVYPINEEFKWVVKKWYIGNALEIKVEYHNLRYLMDNQKNITKKEFNRRKVTKSCYIYSVKQNLQYLPSNLINTKYNKKHIQFIHDELWFKDFRMRNEICFIKI